jgi:hypothetical protein
MKRSLIGLLLLASACTGYFDGNPGGPNAGDPDNVGGAGGDPNDPSGGDGPIDIGEARQPLCRPDTRDKKGPRLLRRLTKDEFEATVRAAFGFDAATYAGSELPPDTAAVNGMTNQADLLVVGDGVAERVLSSAERVGDLVSSDAHLTRILPCAAAVSDACADEFLDVIGRRLYRRPLSDEEKNRYRALRDTVGADGGEFRDWIKWATVAMLTSPGTMYRSELGRDAGDGSYELDGYERATALAFTFTGGPPSDALLDAAARGELDSLDGVREATRSLVYDEAGAIRPAFATVFRSFVSKWLGLASFDNRDKDTTVFPDWSSDVRTAMRGEIDRFVEEVVFVDKGGIAELLSAPYTMLDARLSAFYGYGSVVSGEYERVTRPDGWGIGLLSQGALLALKATNRDTSPTQRGHAIRARILCDEIPPPPPNVGMLPEPTAADTTRERYEQLHAVNESCSACHKAMDPIGFTFEHLDATGRYRAAENGFEIDDSGLIVAMKTGEEDVSVTGPTELAQELSDREAAGACFGAFFASFSFGFDEKDSACLVSTPRDALAQGESSLLDFLSAITGAPHFTRRVDE